jgi:acyl-coenzyme A synthetase/AMP-(fatty) acid ligase
MSDCKAKVLVTSDGAWRGEKLLLLKSICDEALERAKTKHKHVVSLCVVVSHLARVTPCGELPDDIKSLVSLPNNQYRAHRTRKRFEGGAIRCVGY